MSFLQNRRQFNFDRSLIKDSLGIDTILWEVTRQIPLERILPPFPLPTNKVRASYTFRRSDIQKLKSHVLATKPGLVRVSSFIVTVSYVWSCLAKAGDDGYALEQIVVPVDARGRLNGPTGPSVPANYFGNCVALAATIIEHEKLAGDGGFETAAEAVAEEIKRRVRNEGELVKGAENWMSDFQTCESVGTRVLGVSGSPKFDLSVADFGWGKATKMENLTLDGDKFSMSLCNSNESGGLEYGVSLPMQRMKAFAAAFSHGLSS